MQDKKIQTALLALLRLGLWGKEEVTDALILSAPEWAALYAYAQRHTIEGIVFDSLQHLPDDVLPPRDLLLKWTVKIDQIERHNKQMNTCIREQLDFFNREGLFPVLLKGQGVASCYPIPNHRVCGDIDWYFENKKDYQKANELVWKGGIAVSYMAGFSTAYLWKGIVTEHHQRMFDIHNPFSFLLLKRLQIKFNEQQIQQQLEGHTLLLPAPMLMMIQVNVHILKHLLAFGIGVRQLCDAARVYHTFRLNVDGEELKQVYKKLGILKWVNLLHFVLVKYIGLRRESLPFVLSAEVDADWMMNEIWLSGNFGFFYPQLEMGLAQPDFSVSQPSRRVWSNLSRYFRFAPMEAMSFPLVQVYSKFGGNN
jgi:hypothetical protein